jgi:phospholipase/carboxylesterase
MVSTAKASRTEHLAGVLTTRVQWTAASAQRPGLHPLASESSNEAFLLVPETQNAPLVIALHGAGGDARQMLDILAPAPSRGIAVLAVSSLNATWDVIRGGYGPDVRHIDAALARVPEFASVDPRRIAIAGFSDGASYALSLGLINGDLFREVLAFSPGFVAPGRPKGQPRIFISHGAHDDVLPVDRCSRRIVAGLQQAEYAVDYFEFDGGHSVPPEAVERGLLHCVGR